VELVGKVVIVTGASRGIGKQVALALGQRGASVVVAARTIAPRKQLPGTLGETVEMLDALGAPSLAVRADMAVGEDLIRLVNETMARFGRIDVLVNNAAATAGRGWGAPLIDLSREEWMAQYAVNLHAPYTLMRAVAPIMQQTGGGRIINLTTAGHNPTDEALPIGLPVPLAYPSSKAALDQLCRSVAPQLRALGVSVVNIHPGFVRTEMVDQMVKAGLDASQSIPMDIPTRAITYLATCDSPMAYTGQILEAAVLLRSLGLFDDTNNDSETTPRR
jgi:NAD(P)-dependent dehydrogenase (short-subunit alcohol dehydrogenase family)